MLTTEKTTTAAECIAHKSHWIKNSQLNAQRKKAGLIIFLLSSFRKNIFLPLLCEREEKFFAANKQHTAIHHSDELFFLK